MSSLIKTGGRHSDIKFDFLYYILVTKLTLSKALLLMHSEVAKYNSAFAGAIHWSQNEYLQCSNGMGTQRGASIIVFDHVILYVGL